MPNTNQITNFITNAINQCKTIKHLHQIHAHAAVTGVLSVHRSSIPTKILHSITTVAGATTTTQSSAVISVLTYAFAVFNSIPNPSTFCYNNVIRVHILLNSTPHHALRLFTQMHRCSVPPDFHTFPFVFKACMQFREILVAQMVHSQALKFGFGVDLFVMNSLIHVYSFLGCVSFAAQVFDESPERDVVSYNSLIDGFLKAGEIDRARKVFHEMPVRDSVSWGTLIAGYAHVNRCDEAIDMFNQMIALGVQPDNIALVSTLSACAQIGELEQGKIIHNYVKRNMIRLDSFLSTGLVDLYAKCGCIEIAREIFDASLDKNLLTWNAMLVGFAMHGLGKLSLDYFTKMVESRVKPDSVSLLGVLVGCSHSGLVNEARELFNGMKSIYGVTPELKHYGCMADLLGRAGLIGEAMEMIKRMPMGGDVFVWGGLLGGCRIHGNVEIAEKAAEQVMEIKPEDGGVYSVMADVYANAERWEDVVKMRRLMKGKKVKRNAGCSLIKLNGISHEFVAWDSLHPQTEEIFSILNILGKHQAEHAN